MLLDTGADETCFPARFAAFFGHDNNHPQVVKRKCLGVGGASTTYLHSVQISLLDPAKSTRSNHVIAWTARDKQTTFIEKFDCGFGLLGMNIMKKWKSVTFESGANGPIIRIVL